MMRMEGIRHDRGWLRAVLAGLVGLVALPAAAAAQDTAILDLTRLYQTDARALAMGNAFGPVARGEGALLHNPAGLVQYQRDVKLEYQANAAGETGGFLEDTLDVFNGDPSDEELEDYLEKYLDESRYYRANTFPNAVANLAEYGVGLGAGQIDQQQYYFRFNDGNNDGFTPTPTPSDDTLTLTRQRLQMSMFSFGFQMARGRVLLGVTGKSFTFSEEAWFATVDEVLADGEIDPSLDGPSYSGTAYDVGMLLRSTVLPALRGQLSLTAHNVGGATLEPDDAAFDKLEVATTYNAGLSISPELGSEWVALTLSAELEDATGAIKVHDPDDCPTMIGASGNASCTDDTTYDRSLAQRTHYGAEFGIWQMPTGNYLVAARAGSHRGLPTWGWELNLFNVVRAAYTRYKDDFGHEDNEDVREFDAAMVSVGFAW